MDGSASIGLEQAILGHSLGFAPFAAPTQVYVSLCLASTAPSETVPGLEASGGGYARMPATFALIAGPSNIAANTTSIEFPQALSSWGQIGFFELWDAPSGGNRLYWGQLVDTSDFTTPLVLQVSAGDITRFSAGTLAVQAATGSGGTVSIGAYLPLAGGAMAGPLLLAAEPTDLSHAATKSYVDAHSGAAGGPGFLPLSGGNMLGPLGLGTSLVWGAITTTGFGYAPGQIPYFATRGGRPSFELNGQWIINQATPTGTQGADIFIRHDGSAVNTGTSANINSMMNMTMTVGANDQTSNWGLVVHPSTNATTGNQVVGAFIATDRLPGSNSHCWGALINVADQTGSPSSVVGQATLGQENDFASSLADDAVNPAKWGGIGNRHLVHYIATRFSGAAQNQVTTGLWFGTTNAYFDSIIGMDVGSTRDGGAQGTQVRQVLDTRGAIAPLGVTDPVAAVRMSAGQIVDFNGGPALNSAPGNYLQYTTTGTPRLRYMDGAAEVFAISDNGGIFSPSLPIDLRFYGAALDGVANDSAAYAAARTAANARGTVGGVVVAPPGSKRGTLTPPPYVAPPVLWKIDGQTFGTSGTTPVTNVTSGDLVETFFSGQKMLSRTDPVGNAFAPVMRLDFTGAGASTGVLRVTATGNDNNAYITAINSELTLTGSGNATGPVSVGSHVTRTAGVGSSWSWWGTNADQTGDGLVVGAADQQVGFENQLLNNGPDLPDVSWNPDIGGRVNFHLIQSDYVPPSWVASRPYAVNAVVTPGNGYVYVVQVAGTSGASPPVWPTSTGTVVDGTVTWKYGTTVHASYGKALHIAGNADLGAAILVNPVGKISDAVIEMSGATLDTVTNPNAAAIRIAANMPIDFSGNGTAAGQNQHTLRYDSASSKLIYSVAGVAKFSVDASGNVRAAGTITGSVTP